MKPIALLFLSLFAVSPCLAQSKPSPLTVNAIISLSIKSYSQLKSYTDSGKLIQTFLTNKPNKSAKVFKTAYVNTGNINFEYYQPGKSNSLYTINRTNNEVKTWWGLTNQNKKVANLPLALGAALGVSGGTSFMVPQLLLPADFKNQNLYSTLTKPVLAATQPVNGKDCYKITGTNHYGQITLWIAKTDFLIRKIETSKVVDPAKNSAYAVKLVAKMKASGNKLDKAQMEAIKALAAKHKMDSLRGKAPGSAFTVNSTYTFFPTAGSKINPEMLKFRPNRKVAL